MIYEKFEVWEKSKDDDFIYVYVCFKDIEKDVYFVQSIDAYRKSETSFDAETRVKQSIELFLEVPIEERVDSFSTLREAVFSAKEWAELDQ